MMAKILIVDDSRTSRKVLREIMEEGGYEVVAEAENGEEAVKLYEELHPDIVTLDITMPVMDGIDTLRQLKDFDAEAKVIMVSSAGQKSKMVEAVKYGAMDFIAKPFDEEQLLEIIAKNVVL